MSWIIAVLVTSLLFVLPGTTYPGEGKNLIDKEIQRRLAMGDKPNRLIEQKSPYLLQHAFNPVDWLPWGEEAFAKAAAEDKPVFLSIGYSTCHWCHVMAHESFENPEVAALLNKWFISIKVDREERPDIDQMYMAATQALSGSGGWPMSVFLLPDGSPFYAGTYFPPTSSQYRPGFSELLTALHEAWQQRRGDLEQAAQRLVAALKVENKGTGDVLKADIIKRGFWLFAQDNDPTYGGFGQAPKFPRPAVLRFLFDYYHTTGEDKAKDMALHTLQKMASGGIYDHLGGGFHRYSVDKSWFVPHFEKMLYDQSQLANVYLDAFVITGDTRYSQIARQIFDYLLRDMHDSGGGFYSAEDADSDDPYAPGEHGEGAYYLWTEEDIITRLGNDDAALFTYSYGVKSGGNVAQDPLQEFTDRNILHRAHSSDETADFFKIDSTAVERRLADSRTILFGARSARKRPHLDDKIITGWNGLLIGALARGSRLLQDPVLLEHAKQAATFIKNHLYEEDSQTLHRRYRAGESGLTGQLDDYTSLVAGLIDLYQASQEPQWLKWALVLTKRQIDLFWNEKGGFFYDSVADKSVTVRMRSMYDGAEPAANSIAASNLIRLGQIRNQKEWQEMAKRLIESFGTTIDKYPQALPLMLSAWQTLNSKPMQAVIAGTRGAQDTAALIRVADRYLPPHSQFLLADGDENQRFLSEQLPFMENVSTLGDQATAYVCVDFTCSLPVTSPQSLKQLLTEQKKSNEPE
jgi:uncharacterized protein YyaL (SSP411 family)